MVIDRYHDHKIANTGRRRSASKAQQACNRNRKDGQTSLSKGKRVLTSEGESAVNEGKAEQYCKQNGLRNHER